MNTFLSPTTADHSDSNLIDQLPVAYVELNAEGLVTRANLRALQHLQLEVEEVIGKKGWEFVAVEEIRESQKTFLAAMQSGSTPRPIRRSLYAKSGRFLTFDLYRSLILGTDGRPIGMRYVFFDVTELFAMHEEDHRARTQLEGALESIAEGVVITDSLGFITYANQALEELTGWKPGELVGMIIEERLPILPCSTTARLPFNYRVALEQRCRAVVVILDRKRYQLRVEISSSPIVEKSSNSTCGMVILLHHAADNRTSSLITRSSV
jgi:PAS domain S-box-containing protein